MAGAKVCDITTSLKNTERRDDVKRVVVLAGGNDLTKDTSTETLLKQFEDLLAELKRVFPGAKLAVSALLPRKSIPLRFIIAFNHQLQRTCAKAGVIYFIEQNFVRRNEVVKSCFSGDGVHLSTSGLSLWLKQVIAILEISRNQWQGNTQFQNSQRAHTTLPPRLSTGRKGLHVHMHQERPNRAHPQQSYLSTNGSSDLHQNANSGVLSNSHQHANSGACQNHRASQHNPDSSQSRRQNVPSNQVNGHNLTGMLSTQSENSKPSSWQSTDVQPTSSSSHSEHNEQSNGENSQPDRSNHPFSPPYMFPPFRLPNHNRQTPMYPPWWNSFHPMMFNPLMFMHHPH